jgi:hypothetical protein
MGKPAEVALWGISGSTDEYLTFLAEAGVGVAVCVDRERAGARFHDIEIIGPEDYARRCYLYHRLPLVVTARGAHDAAGFNDALREIVSRLDLSGTVLHPVALADYLRFDHGGRVLLGGFPGAGNIVVQEIVRRLLEGRERPLGTKERRFAAHAREYHFGTLLPAVDGLFDLGGRYATRASALRAGRIRVDMQLANERLATLSNLRSRTYLYESLSPTHEPLTAAVVDRFRSMRWTVVAVIRNPLDVLVSNAARLAHPPTRVLANLDWVRRLATVLREYCMQVLAQRDRGVALVRYEQLVEQPAASIQALAGALDIDLDPAAAEALWNDVGYKSLVPGSVGSSRGRPPRPGTGTWQEFLGRPQRQVLEDLGFGVLLDALGYPSALDGGAAAEETQPLDPRAQRDAAVLDYGYHLLYGKPVDFRSDALTIEREAALDVDFMTSDANLWELMRIGLAARLFRRMLLAGTVP